MKKLTIKPLALALLFPSVLSAKPVYIKLENPSGAIITSSQIKMTLTNKNVSGSCDTQGLCEIDLPLGESTLDIDAGYQAHFHYIVHLTESDQYLPDNPLIIPMANEPEHQIVVNANPLEHTSLDMATPIILLAGNELVSKRSGTLGEILLQQPGLSVSSFGPAVSRPIIRGLSGARVKIVNNQMTIQDASTTSADHDVGVEPLLAEQIEVVKGPASLLYGSGAIGGVVNVTDRKMSADIQQGLTGGIELRIADSTTDEQSAVFTLDRGSEDWNWHLDGYRSSTGDLGIPGLAESSQLRAQEEQEGAEDSLEHDESSGRLDNTHSETKGGSLGISYLFEQGQLGFAVSQTSKQYGIPGHDHQEGEEALIEEENVSIDMKQTRYDLQLNYDEPLKDFDKLFVGLSYTDYQHQEFEGMQAGTLFENDASELRSYLRHQPINDWSGIVGVQLSKRDFSALGDEAFIPPSKTNNYAVFWLEEKSFGSLKWELGARYESQSIAADGEDKRSDSGVSFSSGAVYTLSAHNKLAVNLSHSVRFPVVEEYFSFGPHLATQSFEVGNENLKKETASNLDLSYRFESDWITGEINLFENRFSNFIYAANATNDDLCISEQNIEQAEIGELQLLCYQQTDAVFRGLELQFDMPMGSIASHTFQLDVTASYVRAYLIEREFTTSRNLPRIPPLDWSIGVRDDFGDFSGSLNLHVFSTQDNVADNELITRGFKILDFELNYRLFKAESEWFVFLKGNNLLDQEARDHASFIKDIAPRAARHVLMGVRYQF